MSREVICMPCAEIRRGAGDVITHSGLVGTGSGTAEVGGRPVRTSLFRCHHCGAAWLRETDVRTLSNVWYFQSHARDAA
jgi:hypothetical protein